MEFASLLGSAYGILTLEALRYQCPGSGVARRQWTNISARLPGHSTVDRGVRLGYAVHKAFKLQEAAVWPSARGFGQQRGVSWRCASAGERPGQECRWGRDEEVEQDIGSSLNSAKTEEPDMSAVFGHSGSD